MSSETMGTPAPEKRRPGRPMGTTKAAYLAPSREELGLFFKVVRAARDYRNDLAFSLTYYLGLRVAELVGLRLSDFVDVTGVGLIVSVQGLKGGFRRETEITDPSITGKIRRWILRQRRPLRPGNPYLFPSEDPARWDQPLSRDFFQDAFKRYAAKAGLSPAHSIHGLRHACAINLVTKGMSAPAVQRWLRLRQLSTAQIYFSRQEFAALDQQAADAFREFM